MYPPHLIGPSRAERSVQIRPIPSLKPALTYMDTSARKAPPSPPSPSHPPLTFSQDSCLCNHLSLPADRPGGLGTHDMETPWVVDCCLGFGVGVKRCARQDKNGRGAEALTANKSPEPPVFRFFLGVEGRWEVYVFGQCRFLSCLFLEKGLFCGKRRIADTRHFSFFIFFSCLLTILFF